MEKTDVSMMVEPAVTYLDDPRYQEATNLFQHGRWEAGLAMLDQLLEQFPLEVDLRTLRQEMALRARVDLDEATDMSDSRRRRLRNLLLWGSVLGLLVIGGIWAADRYADLISRRWQSTRANLEQEFRDLELAVTFRDAHDLLEADRPVEALLLFDEVARVSPDYPGLDVALAQAQSAADLSEEYERALRLVESGDLIGALVILEAIAAQEPYFRDVTVQIAELERNALLGETLAQAEQDYQAGRWEAAITGLESVRALDPKYQSEAVEEQLFRSYVNAADEVLAAREDSMASLELAENYYRKALALRPQDSEVLSTRALARETTEERLVRSYVDAAQSVLSAQGDSLEALALAERYLRDAMALRPNDPDITLQLNLAQSYQLAQDDFNRGLWGQVIEGMEFVYTNDREYALGAARQTLYEAYVARGDSEMASGEYEAALSDYQRAAVLAEQDPESILRLYESQIKAANAHGVMGNYQNAVLLYRSAVELGDLQARARAENAVLAAALFEADGYAEDGNYRTAFRRYREALRRADETYDTIVHEVESGEYLTMLASRYGSTVQAIVLANDITNPNRIYTNQELIIPVFR